MFCEYFVKFARSKKALPTAFLLVNNAYLQKLNF